jgi:two-component system sensor histidine kinase/response regulator
MNGFDATKEIRRLEKTGRLDRHTPIIALTANAGAESEEECVKAGMDAFLTKPLSMATLSTALEKFIAAGPIITGVQLL